MKTYIVGGYVRDLILGIIPKDKDFVVTDSTASEMLSLNYIPVGKSHQVFLHPETKEEYTLTNDLYQDLTRRDLTINALALDGEKIIDYFGGVKDIKNQLLKHLDENNFYHDPLRVFRVARFSAELPEFTIHPDTLNLMMKVSDTQQFRNIPHERVFSEIEKAIKAAAPEKFFQVLRLTRCMDYHFPELLTLNSDDWKESVDLLASVKDATRDPVIRFSSLFIYSGPHSENSLRIPSVWRESSEAIRKYYLYCQHLYQKTGNEIVDMFYRLDAFRKPYLIQVLWFLLKSGGHRFSAVFLDECFEITSSISSRHVPIAEGPELGASIREERARALNAKLALYQEVRNEGET